MASRLAASGICAGISSQVKLEIGISCRARSIRDGNPEVFRHVLRGTGRRGRNTRKVRLHEFAGGVLNFAVGMLF